ncbi:HU family DNA-binding protein [bacterium]|nr:HU family DNA-binding protein [bacterium]
MTKEKFVEEVARRMGTSKARADKAVKTVLNSISDVLKRGEKVTFVGFGTFEVAERAARMGRNPRTGEEIRIPATKVPKFRPGKGLREAVK